MYSLRSVDVMSCAKMMGALYGCLGLIFLPFLLLGGFGSLLFGHGSASFEGIAMLFLAILAPVIYGAMGRIGGIQLELKPVAVNSPSNLGLI